MKINWFILLGVLGVIAAGLYLYSPVGFQQKSPPPVLHVGILPDQNMDNLYERYDPLLKHLAAETGIKFELVIPSSYSELIQLIGNRKVDMAYLGGLTFLQAHTLYGVQPLVMRDVDMRFISVFFSKDNNASQDLIDFKDKVFSFGSRYSTSGHLMPRHFMKINKQIIPEEFFSEVRFSGAHDKTAYLIRDGKADVGVANAEIIRAMFQDGRLKEKDLYIFRETPPYPDYVWAVDKDLADDVRNQLRDVFLGLEIDNIDQENILRELGAGEFLPAGINDFVSLKNIAEPLGLLKLDK